MSGELGARSGLWSPGDAWGCPRLRPLLTSALPPGDLPALGPGPLLPSQPSLLSPALGGALGLQLLQAQPPLLGQPGAPGPLAYLLQSLQVSGWVGEVSLICICK